MKVIETGRPWSGVDQVMLSVVRLVQDEHWSVVGAAAELRAESHEQAALAQARARLAAVQLQRRSVFGDRAIALLSAALGQKADDDGTWLA